MYIRTYNLMSNVCLCNVLLYMLNYNVYYMDKM